MNDSMGDACGPEGIEPVSEDPLSYVTRSIEDKSEFAAMMRRVWGSDRLVVGLYVYDVTQIELTGLFDLDGQLLAVASWTMRNNIAYICALHSMATGCSHAKTLLVRLKQMAVVEGAKSMRAMVSNDNMPGFVFYQKQGFRFSNLYVGAVDAFRPIMPTLITTGYRGIPVHDALELEILL
jgi:hypothetical protein